MSVLAGVFQTLARFLRAGDYSPGRKPVGATKFDSKLAFFSQLQNSGEIQLAESTDPYSFNLRRKTWKLPPSLVMPQLPSHSAVDAAIPAARASLKEFLPSSVGPTVRDQR